MYEGSMVGAGAVVFAVWGYCIANADPDLHTVRLNPKVLGVILGEEVSEIEKAIRFLTDKDDDSCCTDEEGRRLVNTSGMEYIVVSHAHYRAICNSGDRREYMKNYMRERRKKEKSDTDTKADTDTEVNNGKLTGLTNAKPRIKKPEKSKYGELESVLLTDDEYEKIKTKQGQARLNKGIEVLDTYIASKGAKYKSHYATMKADSWVWERVSEAMGTEKSFIQRTPSVDCEIGDLA